jgi:hypothetical protein
MAQNNDGPGKRLKQEQAKNTLYVNNHNDPKMFAYKKAIDLYEKQKKVYDSETPKGISYDELLKTKPSFDMAAGEPEYGYTESGKPIYARKKPEIKIVFRKETSEPIKPKQATINFPKPEEIVAPVMRPVSVPDVPIEEPVIEKPIETEKREVFYRNNKGQRKPPKAVMPSRQGGWGNQPLLMKLFPKLYEK